VTQKNNESLYFVITLNSIEFAFSHFCFVLFCCGKLTPSQLVSLEEEKKKQSCEKLGSLQQGLFKNKLKQKML
jgi:hypothetical protein